MIGIAVSSSQYLAEQQARGQSVIGTDTKTGETVQLAAGNCDCLDGMRPALAVIAVLTKAENVLYKSMPDANEACNMFLVGRYMTLTLCPSP